MPARRGRDNYRNIEGDLFARMLSKPETREKYPAFLFVPQCPPGYSWGGYSSLPTVDTLVFETISTLKKEFAIDENRLYVAGHSLGGYGAWYFISTRPDMFAAAIPVAGEGDADLAENMRDVAIWAFHEANDINVPVSGSRGAIEAMRKGGADPRYTESPDGGHSWKIVEDTPGVLDWLFAQKRK
jgi:predicted peptidase